MYLRGINLRLLWRMNQVNRVLAPYLNFRTAARVILTHPGRLLHPPALRLSRQPLQPGPRLFPGEGLSFSALALVPDSGEVDVASLNIRAHEFHSYFVSDVKAIRTRDYFPFDRWLEEPDPRSLVGRACHDGVEPLPYPRFEQQGGGGFAKMPLDFFCIVFFLRTIAGKVPQFL
jgi:hypothetical protein